MKRASMIVVLLAFIATAKAEEPLKQKVLSGEGLIGTYFNSDDFERPETGMIDVLPTVDCEWGDNRGSDWSARWSGFVKAPITGEVTFIAEVQDGIRLTIGNAVVMDSLQQGGIHTGIVNMIRGRKAPIELEFVSSTKKALLRLYWQWAGKEKEIIAQPTQQLRGKIRDITPEDLGKIDDYDEPTFIRQKKAVGESSGAIYRGTGGSNINDNDLDVPTFLRRKAD